MTPLSKIHRAISSQNLLFYRLKGNCKLYIKVSEKRTLLECIVRDFQETALSIVTEPPSLLESV